MVIDNYFSLVLLAGAAFSLMFSMYLIFYPINFYANRVLGVLTLSWSISVFAFVLQSKDFFLKFPHLYASPDVLTLLFFPLIFIYIKSYLYADARQFYSTLVHFIPAVLYIIVFSPFLFKSGEAKMVMIDAGMPDWYYTYQSGFNLVIIAQGIFYTILSLRTLYHFQYFRKGRLTKLQKSSIQWLRVFIIINVFLWTIGATGAVLGMVGVFVPIDLFYIFYFGLTLLTLFLGIFTVFRPQFFGMRQDVRSIFTESRNENTTDSKAGESEPEYKMLIDYFEMEKPYLKNDLKMDDLVEGTGLNAKRISDILNNNINKTFFDMVNDYRSKEAIRLIEAGFHKKHTLMHLAEKAGFNSKTTFNRIFKKYTGQTPSEFIQSKA